MTPMPPREPEKRSARRARHDSVLELFDASGQLIAGIGRLVDVSTTGLCFAMTRPLPVGQAIRARLRHLKEGVLHFEGHVVWNKRKTNTYLCGVEFDAITPEPRGRF